MTEYTKKALAAGLSGHIIRGYIKPYDAIGLAERARLYYETNMYYADMPLMDFVMYMAAVESKEAWGTRHEHSRR